ncbi:hypothetical protein B0H13DRAFT_1850135 [Mycena leptocephala]|nr:hypothetical protein B0H13DRAFT_1850135 [Mycena leptocephala]
MGPNGRAAPAVRNMDFAGPKVYKICPKGGNSAVFYMQSGDSSEFGFGSSDLNHRDDPNNLFGWELPQATSIQQDFRVSNPFVGYDPISLENLHQRLLWVENTILGWQMLGEVTIVDGNDVQGIPSRRQSVQPEPKGPTYRDFTDDTVTNKE